MFQKLLKKLTKSWQAHKLQQDLEKQKLAATGHRDSLERLAALKLGVRLRQASKSSFQQTSNLYQNQGKSLREKQKRVLRHSQYRMLAASIATQTNNQSLSGGWERI